MSHGLHIFRYGNGIGMRNHKMAFVQCMDDGEIRLLFHDRSVKTRQTSTSIVVNDENLKKSKMYRSIFDRDIDALEESILTTNGIMVCAHQMPDD